MLKRFVAFFIIVLLGTAAMAAPQVFSATVPVNVTSDTAATAKNMAMDSARRQVLSQALSAYTNKAQLADAIKSAKSSDLANLISSSRIDGERQSATSYTANVTMTLDMAAVRRWLTENNVQSWLPDSSGGDMVVIVVNLRNKMSDWIELNRIARGENVELNTRGITGAQMTISMPDASRRMFVSAARSAGWQSSDDSGVTHMWK